MHYANICMHMRIKKFSIVSSKIGEETHWPQSVRVSPEKKLTTNVF